MNQHRSLGSNYQNPSTFLNEEGAATKLAKPKLSHQIKSTSEKNSAHRLQGSIQGRAWYEFPQNTSRNMYHKSAKPR